ncbi:Integrin beta-like protein A [Bienertia sinuspersici]
MDALEFSHSNWTNISLKLHGEDARHWNFWHSELKRRHYVSIAWALHVWQLIVSSKLLDKSILMKFHMIQGSTFKPRFGVEGCTATPTPTNLYISFSISPFSLLSA